MGGVKPSPPPVQWRFALFHFVAVGPHWLTFNVTPQSIKTLPCEGTAAAKSTAASDDFTRH